MNNKNEFFWELRKKVQEFEKLDSVLIEKILSPRDFKFLGKVLEAKKEVKRLLSEKKAINIGPDRALAEKLKNIRGDVGYSIDEVWPIFEELSGEQFSQSTEDIDYVDALFSEGTADYVDEKFFQRRNEIGAIIGGQSLPEIFLHHLSMLKQCYSLGLFESTVIHCRAVIESGVFHSLKRRGKIRTDKKTTDYGEYSLKDLLNRIKPYINSSVHKKAEEVVKLANKILHEKRNIVAVSKSDAYDAIKSTFTFIEDLFA